MRCIIWLIHLTNEKEVGSLSSYSYHTVFVINIMLILHADHAPHYSCLLSLFKDGLLLLHVFNSVLMNINLGAVTDILIVVRIKVTTNIWVNRQKDMEDGKTEAL